MGLSVVEQPDGKLALFHSVSDSFDLRDATDDEAVDYLVARAAHRARVDAVAALERARSDKPDLTYDECRERYIRVHGDVISATRSRLQTTSPTSPTTSTVACRPPA